jgi:hypothetical protein
VIEVLSLGSSSSEEAWFKIAQPADFCVIAVT